MVECVCFHGPFTVEDVQVVGLPGRSRAARLWPSDHAGIVAALTLRLHNDHWPLGVKPGQDPTRLDFARVTPFRSAMARSVSSFVCQNCGAAYSRWQGPCHSCRPCNTLPEP